MEVKESGAPGVSNLERGTGSHPPECGWDGFHPHEIAAEETIADELVFRGGCVPYKGGGGDQHELGDTPGGPGGCHRKQSGHRQRGAFGVGPGWAIRFSASSAV